MTRTRCHNEIRSILQTPPKMVGFQNGSGIVLPFYIPVALDVIAVCVLEQGFGGRSYLLYL